MSRDQCHAFFAIEFRVVSETDGYINSEPGAVATGSVEVSIASLSD